MATSTGDINLQPAAIEWRGDRCYAPQFEDVYGNVDAVGEVHRVFLSPTRILDAAQHWSRVAVGELGFGTGFNFVVTAAAVLKIPGTRLHFVSAEKHPLAYDDWQTVRALHGESFPLYHALATHPLPILPGWHRRVFAQGRIVLSVFHGDASVALEELVSRQKQSFDAWYLDGFTPARNPEMWSLELLQNLARTCHRGATVATFSAAGLVRRRLQQAGFAVRKLDQRPYKRESLAGELITGRKRDSGVSQQSVQIVGAGLGGATMARHLAEQGIEVEVIDPHGVATGASSIPAALLHGRLLGDGSPTATHRVTAYHYAEANLATVPGVTSMPVVQLAGPNLSIAKMTRTADAYHGRSAFHQYWLSLVEQTSLKRMGISGHELALLFPSAKLVDLGTTTRALLGHRNIRILPPVAATLAEVLSPPAHGTHAQILCSGLAAVEHAPEASLEIAPVYGQIDELETRSKSRNLAIVGNGYWIPRAGRTFIGATYEYQPWSPDKATQQNIASNEAYLTEPCRPLNHFRGVRAVTSDRMPIVGPLSPGRWIATAHGSMGTTSAPLAAAIICAELMGWISPVPTTVSAALAPARFKHRQARRGQLHNGKKKRSS